MVTTQHPYGELIVTNVRSEPLNVRSKPLNVRSKPLNGDFNVV